jgi:hypothetical protein
MPERRFPPPWSVEELNDACIIVKDNAGQKLAYVYFENESADDQQLNCSPATRRGGLRPTWRSCRSCSQVRQTRDQGHSVLGNLLL